MRPAPRLIVLTLIAAALTVLLTLALPNPGARPDPQVAATFAMYAVPRGRVNSLPWSGPATMVATAAGGPTST